MGSVKEYNFELDSYFIREPLSASCSLDKQWATLDLEYSGMSSKI